MTAEEFVNNLRDGTGRVRMVTEFTVKELMIKFAQYHVEQALKNASKQLEDVGAELSRCYDEVEKSILNCYPKENIK